MGVTGIGEICSTCGQNNMNCPGHFGHIELANQCIIIILWKIYY